MTPQSGIQKKQGNTPAYRRQMTKNAMKNERISRKNSRTHRRAPVLNNTNKEEEKYGRHVEELNEIQKIVKHEIELDNQFNEQAKYVIDVNS
jgi:hypothetical protein